MKICDRKNCHGGFFFLLKKIATRVSCLLMDSAAVRTVDVFRIYEPILIFNSPKHFIALSLRGELRFSVNIRPGLGALLWDPFSGNHGAIFSKQLKKREQEIFCIPSRNGRVWQFGCRRRRRLLVLRFSGRSQRIPEFGRWSPGIRCKIRISSTTN